MKPVKPQLSAEGVGYNRELFSLSYKNARAERAPTKLRATTAPAEFEASGVPGATCGDWDHIG